MICRAEKLQIWQAESLHIAVKPLGKFSDVRQFLDLLTVNEEEVWSLCDLVLFKFSLSQGTCSHLPELLDFCKRWERPQILHTLDGGASVRAHWYGIAGIGSRC